MPIRPDEPLRRVTLNLYASDCEYFEHTYGHGWTERIRQHLHNEVTKRKGAKSTRRLGDLGFKCESEEFNGSRCQTQCIGCKA